MLEELLKITNGQQLIDSGYVPKTISDHLALVSFLRLQALRDRAKAVVSGGVDLGAWMPAVEPKYEDVDTEITDPAIMGRYIRDGMTVRVNGPVDTIDLTNWEGVVKQVDSRHRRAAIEFAQEFEGGNDVRGTTAANRGYALNFDAMTLLVPDGKAEVGLKLINSAVADENLGHLVRFPNGYEGPATPVSGGYDTTIKFPANHQGTLIGYNADKEIVGIKLGRVEGGGSNQNFFMRLDNLREAMTVSSLGQFEPKRLEDEVKNAALKDFFPRTIMDEDLTYQIITTLIMGRDILLGGPSGSGKSQLMADILSLSQHIDTLPLVDGTVMQDNPFSVFDPDGFGKKLEASPMMLLAHDSPIEGQHGYEKTNRFTPPKPADVPVVMAHLGLGNGIEMIEGTTAVSRVHIAGQIIPNFQSETPFSIQHFVPGIAQRTNNGILGVDEVDKMRPDARDLFLLMLQGGKVKPDDMRYSTPADNYVVVTCNDMSVLSEALNDRVVIFNQEYSKDPDVAREILLASFYGLTEEISDVAIPSTYNMQPLSLKRIPTPAILDMAMGAFYIKFRQEYKGSGKLDIMGSNRSFTKDAPAAARAKLLIDQVFYGDEVPAIVDETYMMRGIKFALTTRVAQNGRDEHETTRNDLRKWVDDSLPDIIAQERDTWWCEMLKEQALRSSHIDGYEDNMRTELAAYLEGDQDFMDTAFDGIKKAHEAPNNTKAQRARIVFPVMDYFSRPDVQPFFTDITQPQLHQLISYYMDAYKESSCKLE